MPDNPSLVSKYGVYVYSWTSPAHFSITLDRIRDDHDIISAEIALRNGNATPIYISRYNLFSSPTRKGLANDIDSILHLPDFDWRKTIEYISKTTILQHRESQPMIKIGKLPPMAGPRWRLKPLIPEGDTSVLFGPGGAGKSMLALICGIAVQHGWQLPGLEATQGNVAYFDWEWGENEHNQRMKSIAAGMQLDFTPELYYQYVYQKIEDVIDTIRQRIMSNNIKFAIFDSKVATLGGAKEAKENSEPLFRSLRSLEGVSCLVIDHTTKDVDGKTRSPYGDIFGTWRPRHVVEIKSVMERENELNLGLFKYKSNLAPSMLRGQFPLGFTIKETDCGTTIELLDIGGVPELAERMSLKMRIMDCLKSGPKTRSEIATVLNSKPDTIKLQLWRGKGFIFINLDPHLKEPRWGLLEKHVTDYVTDG